jgi:aspartate 1-decarboxylase
MQTCLTQAGNPIEKGQLWAMLYHLLRTKLLRAEVTGARLDYEGSLAIDSELMALVGMLPYEKILVGNIANGERFETYAIPAPAGTREVCLNGATAHLGEVGDLLVVMTFAEASADEAKSWKPKTVTLAEKNKRVVRLENPDVSPDLLKTFLTK